jgi:hypothetical protein
VIDAASDLKQRIAVRPFHGCRVQSAECYVPCWVLCADVLALGTRHGTQHFAPGTALDVHVL